METVLIIVAIAIPIVVLIISFIHRKRRIPPPSHDGITIVDITKFSIQEQNAKNVQFVKQIIFGNYKTLSGKRKRKAVRAFDRWQEKENKLWKQASVKQNDLIAEYMMGEKDKHSFVSVIQSENPCKECKGYPYGYELFLKNAFTDPFPSLHDMSDWAISNKLAELFVVHDISSKESRCYLFHLKQYYVNHDMAHGIIQFDLWRIPDPTISSKFPNRLKQFVEGSGDW